MPKKQEFMNQDQELVEIVVIIDKSGSMGGIRNDAIGGFNAFLSDQKKLPGEALMTLAMFDDGYYLVHDGVPLQEVPELDTKTYQPSGSTALLDAIGKTLGKVEARNASRRASKSPLPKSTIVAILTDGEENASKEFKRQEIKDLITAKQDQEGWKVVYLAANVDAFAEAASIGIMRNSTYVYKSTGQGVGQAYEGMTQVVGCYRSGDNSQLPQSHDLSDLNVNDTLGGAGGSGGTYTTSIGGGRHVTSAGDASAENSLRDLIALAEKGKKKRSK